jgi:hypothetical protein
MHKRSPCHLKLGLTGFDIGVGPFGALFRRGKMPGGRNGWYLCFNAWFRKSAYWFGYYSYLKNCEWKLKRQFGAVFNIKVPVLQSIAFGNFRLTRLKRNASKRRD